jgi:hypothetical protein
MLFHKLLAAGVRSASLVASSSLTSSATGAINLPYPTGGVAGDWCFILIATASGGANPPDLPTGFTNIQLVTGNLATRLAYRQLDGTEGANIALTPTSNARGGTAITVRNVTNYISGGIASAEDEITLQLTGVTATTSSLLFAMGVQRDRSSPYTLNWGTAPSGMTTLVNGTSNGSSDCMVPVLYSQNILSGATGTRTLSSPNQSNQDSIAGVLINIY